MLEPRRLAARAAAHRMAQLLGESVGETVGYRVRRDTRVGRATRVEVVTEGVLTRMLNSDPTLDGVGIVIFDEFHERSLNADLGLALTRQTQQLVRDELRILVMSATLDGEPVARLLGGAPIVTSAGRMYPVEARWLPRRSDQRLEGAMAAAIRLALGEVAGDVLAFLPGQGEIHRVAALLGNESLGAGVEVMPLFGNLPTEAQDRAIAPSPPGRRKVVLATSIAESSLTIDGVRCVVDSGLSRVARFSPAIGMTRLDTVRVSRASAEQRAGRAGRLAPGVVYRLWSMEEHAGLIPFSAPEIADADLAPLALELAAAGVQQVEELAWLDRPPAAAMERARSLLRWLGALDADLRITPHGTRMAQLAAHPRIAHMLLRARESGSAALACDVAALVGERDILRPDGPQHDADLRTRIDLLRALRRKERLPAEVHGMRVQRDAAYRALDEANAWRRELGVRGARRTDTVVTRATTPAVFSPSPIPTAWGSAAARAGVATSSGAEAGPSCVIPPRWRNPTTSWLPNRTASARRARSTSPPRSRSTTCDATLATTSSPRSAWRGIRPSTRCAHAASNDSARSHCATCRCAIRRRHWSPRRSSTRCARRRCSCFLGAMAPYSCASGWPSCTPTMPTWPGVSDEDLLAVARRMVGAAPGGQAHRRRPAVARPACAPAWTDSPGSSAARSTRSPRATSSFRPGAASPSTTPIPAAPALAVRLQEMLGCETTPTVLGGRIPVTLQLLSPARRPIQVTRDLAGFWRTSYKDVQKEMKGRYPRHPWPDEPWAAEPTRRVKPR